MDNRGQLTVFDRFEGHGNVVGQRLLSINEPNFIWKEKIRLTFQCVKLHSKLHYSLFVQTMTTISNNFMKENFSCPFGMIWKINTCRCHLNHICKPMAYAPFFSVARVYINISQERESLRFALIIFEKTQSRIVTFAFVA